MKIKNTICVLLALCFLLSVSLVPCSAVAGADIDPQSYLEEQMEEYDISGVAYITKNGRVLCHSTRGMANTAQSKEMSLETLFPIGSNSKQFCAAAILILQEQGKLSVDDTLSQYFPDYTVAQDVTIKNLLTHRSGIREHLEGLFSGYTVSEEATAQENTQEILDWLYTKKLLFNPDKGYRYSNANYLLLSLIVEMVSGQSYAEFIEENIFVPLGMNNSGFYEELVDHTDLAEHTGDTDQLIDARYKGLTHGCGDIVSTAQDMDKWMTSLREYTVLSKESVAEMTTNYSKSDGYGYGIRVQDDGGLCHDGAVVTYLSFTLTYPEDGFNIFAVTNDINNRGMQLMNLVFEAAEDLKDLEIPDLLCGDSDEDGKVNIKDATAIQKHIADLIKLSNSGLLMADVDASGLVNVKDATVIQKHLAGMDTGFPVGGIM
ncbi:MAG: serine hydrolase [Ruminococcus sp.]|nr:serine hydrolase [Ruminococcus sp.]